MNFSCWLKLEFIWSFIGPACAIIIVSTIISQGIITKLLKILQTESSAFF